MLGLLSPTNPDWITAANADLSMLMVDHAHCEKKAAANALSLVNRYPYNNELVTSLIALAMEELEHFARVHAIILERGITMTPDHGDNYARQLKELCRKQEPERFLDALLVAALIEARSCERFSILAKECADIELRTMYADLLASEAGHHALFTSLARKKFSADVVAQRLKELSEGEAKIVVSLPGVAMMHG